MHLFKTTTIKVVVQPAPSADLSGVVFSLSNPNVSAHVTGQTRTLQLLQIVKLQSFNTKSLKICIINN